MGRAKLSPQEFEQIKDELLRKLDSYSDSTLLDPTKAAIVMDVSVHTLDQRRRKGMPPPYIKMDGEKGLVKYELREIRAYIDSCKVTSTSAASVRWGYQFNDGRHSFLQHNDKIIDVLWGKSDQTLSILMSNERLKIGRFEWDEAFDMPWVNSHLRTEYLGDMEQHLLWRISELKGEHGKTVPDRPR